LRAYELMVIHRPDTPETDVRAALEAIQGSLQAQGAEVKETEFWGKRRFAYEIEHLTEGFYSVMEFGAEPTAIPTLDRGLSLSDQVLRHKIVNLSDRPNVSQSPVTNVSKASEPDAETSESAELVDSTETSESAELVDSTESGESTWLSESTETESKE